MCLLARFGGAAGGRAGALIFGGGRSGVGILKLLIDTTASDFFFPSPYSNSK